MSDSWTARIARRPVLAGVLGLFGVSVVGGLAYEGVHLFGRRYPRTKYDDLLDQLADRESAAKLGRAAVAQFQQAHDDLALLRVQPEAIANSLRKGPGGGSLSRALEADVTEGRLVQIQGWLLPVSLVQAAALAANVQQPS